MEITTEAVYIKDSDINIRGNIILELSTAVNKLWPGEALGAQKFHQVWKIYVRSPRTRAALIVNGLMINGVNINVHDDNPVNDNNKQSERVVIKDLPATLSADRILSFLRGLPHIRVKSKVMYAKERIGGEEMSPFINGDRLVYITPNPSPPLPKETVIGGHPCRIWHRSQNNYCKRCDTHGHRTSDTGLCMSYEHDETVIPFRADSNPLSNFFKCTINFHGRAFKSSEHLYQFTKSMYLGDEDLAGNIYSAETPREAKWIAAQLDQHDRMAEWSKIRVDTMRKILHAKWNCSGRFRQTLMSTSNMTIAEATSDIFWGVGVAPNLALHTKPSKFLGSNHLGKLLMDLRRKVDEQEAASIDDVSFDLSLLNSNSNETQSPMDLLTDGMDTTPCTSSSTTTDCVTSNAPGRSTTCPNVVDKTLDSKPPSDNPNSCTIPPPGEYRDSNAAIDEAAIDDATIDSAAIDNAVIDNTAIDNADTSPIDTSSDILSVAEKTGTQCDELAPALMTASNPTAPCRIPRKPRALKPELRRKISQGKLDNFVVRESSLKRKPSGDVIVSPSSGHVDKATRSDDGDEAS